MVHIDRKDGIFFFLLWVAMHGCWDITQELSHSVRQSILWAFTKISSEWTLFDMSFPMRFDLSTIVNLTPGFLGIPSSGGATLDSQPMLQNSVWYQSC